ncbi:MAG: hypothetical protein AAGM22_25000 [Acidobacteriota bacterium]
MIKILTLFLGLSVGIQPVELEVPDIHAPGSDVLTKVASVEVLLDGATVQVIKGPPWSFDLDLGPQLLPHRLTVIGRDSDGQELSRDHRWINLDRFGFDPKPDHCESPCRVTSVAVEVDGGPPPAEAMEGWFTANGEPLRVLAVDRGPAELVVVRDPAVQDWLVIVSKIFLQVEAGVRLPPELSGAIVHLDRDAFNARVSHYFRDTQSRHRLEMAWESWQRFLRFEPETTVRFVSPVAAPASAVEKRKQIFNVTRPLDAEVDGMLYHLARIRPLEFALRISDAVALAGLEAHGGRGRRAVLLLLTDVASGRSRYRPQEVRRYLEALGVPLYVWSFEQPFPEWDSTQIIDYRNQTATISPAKSKNFMRRFGNGFDQINRGLDRQRVVWLEGEHLPQDIQLSPKARGIRLAGSEKAGKMAEEKVTGAIAEAEGSHDG